MTDDEIRAAFHGDRQFEKGFSEAIEAREAEIPTATNARLAELLLLAEEIECYYGAQSSFLGLCAKEAARRLSR